MKHNEVPNISYKITPQNYENIFNVYESDESNDWYYDLLRTVNFPENLSRDLYTIYEVHTGDLWTDIAWKFYRNVKLWWLICSVNQIVNPTQSPKPGTQLKILTNQTVRTLLNQLKGE